MLERTPCEICTLLPIVGDEIQRLIDVGSEMAACYSRILSGTSMFHFLLVNPIFDCSSIIMSVREITVIILAFVPLFHHYVMLIFDLSRSYYHANRILCLLHISL